jgi:hypothetical protein
LTWEGEEGEEKKKKEVDRMIATLPRKDICSSIHSEGVSNFQGSENKNNSSHRAMTPRS